MRLLLDLLALARALSADRARLALENVVLRQQLNVLRRSVKRARINDGDRLFWVLMHRLFAEWKEHLVVVKPETVIRWHRQGFRFLSQPRGPSEGQPVGLLASLVWSYANCPDVSLRDPKKALMLARRLVAMPANSLRPVIRGRLGAALYRAGRPLEALPELKAHLSAAGDGVAGAELRFLAAMAAHETGDKAVAREWYDQAVAWMESHKHDEWMKRFRAEAEEVLGISAEEAKNKATR